MTARNLAQRGIGVVPALNEEATVYEVVKAATHYLGCIIVIDDGSRDATANEARRAGATLLQNDHTLGQGASLLRGLRWAFERDFDFAVTLDADGAHDPHRIPKLVRTHVSEAADLTIGSRFMRGGADLPSPKRSANRFATGLLNSAFDLGVSDAASGMRVIGPRVGKLPITHADFAFAFELLLLSRSAQLKISEAPIRAHYDARELHCTNRGELLNLLDFCGSMAERSPYCAQACKRMSRKVYSWELFSVTVGSEVFVFHPLSQHGAYIIQEQDRSFASQPAGGRNAGRLLFNIQCA